MKRALFATVSLLLLASVAWAQTESQAPANERWLHVRVEKVGEEGEHVRINVPLALAEAVLPTLQVKEFRGGKLKMRHGHFSVEGIDLRALVNAVKNTRDGEFVTVDSPKQSVRVAKEKGYLLVKVREEKEKRTAETVDVKVPITVVEALLSAEEDELNILAALKALSAHGDLELVTVTSPREKVRVWVDSQNPGE